MADLTPDQIRASDEMDARTISAAYGDISPCGCTCGCHNISGHAGLYRGCRKPAGWLPLFRVWACDDCLVMCDG